MGQRFTFDWRSARRNVGKALYHLFQGALGLIGFAVLFYYAPITLGLRLWYAIPFLLLALCVIIVVHECGHALAARRCGGIVQEIRFGFGKTLLSWKVAGCTVLIAAPPLGGWCAYGLPAESNYRRDQAIIYSAGLVTELGFALLVYLLPFDAWLGHQPGRSFNSILGVITLRGDLWQPYQTYYLIISVYGAIWTLLPLRHHRAGRELSSDGGLLLNLVRMTPAEAKLEHAQMLHYYGQSTEASQMLSELLEDPAIRGERRVTALDQIACHCLEKEAPDQCERSLAWIDEAIQIAPDQITLHGTRGSILAELGRHEESRAELREVLARSTSPLDHAISHAYLGWLAAHEQDWEGARHHLAQAHDEGKLGIRARERTRALLGLRTVDGKRVVVHRETRESVPD